MASTLPCQGREEGSKPSSAAFNMKKKKKILTVTIADCRVETLKGSGPGGQHRNKRETAVRITHEPSGATGHSEAFKSQSQNKKAAFKKMARSEKFALWVRMEAGERVAIESRVKDSMNPQNMKYEVRENGKWVEKNGPSE